MRNLTIMSNMKNNIIDKGEILGQVLKKFSVQCNPDQLKEIGAIVDSTANFIELSIKKEEKVVTKKDADQFVYYLLLHILSVHNWIKAMPNEKPTA